MIGWERRVLLRHYLEQGMTKTELAERFGISRQTIYRWIRSGELDRDLSAAGVHYSARAPVATKLDRYRDILVSRLGEYPDLTAVRLIRSHEHHTGPRPAALHHEVEDTTVPDLGVTDPLFEVRLANQGGVQIRQVHEGVVGCGQHPDEDHYAPHLAGIRVHDLELRARVVDEGLLARPVGLTQHHV